MYDDVGCLLTLPATHDRQALRGDGDPTAAVFQIRYSAGGLHRASTTGTTGRSCVIDGHAGFTGGHQPGRRIHQRSCEQLRPLEGHRGPAPGGGGVGLHRHVPLRSGTLSRAPEEDFAQSTVPPGLRQRSRGPCDGVVQPYGPTAPWTTEPVGANGLPQPHQQGHAVCLHHHPLPGGRTTI